MLVSEPRFVEWLTKGNKYACWQLQWYAAGKQTVRVSLQSLNGSNEAAERIAKHLKGKLHLGDGTIMSVVDVHSLRDFLVAEEVARQSAAGSLASPMKRPFVAVTCAGEGAGASVSIASEPAAAQRAVDDPSVKKRRLVIVGGAAPARSCESVRIVVKSWVDEAGGDKCFNCVKHPSRGEFKDLAVGDLLMIVVGGEGLEVAAVGEVASARLRHVIASDLIYSMLFPMRRRGLSDYLVDAATFGCVPFRRVWDLGHGRLTAWSQGQVKVLAACLHSRAPQSTGYRSGLVRIRVGSGTHARLRAILSDYPCLNVQSISQPS